MPGCPDPLLEFLGLGVEGGVEVVDPMACLEPTVPRLGLVAAEAVALGCVAGVDRDHLLQAVAFCGQPLVLLVQLGLRDQAAHMSPSTSSRRRAGCWAP